MEKEIWRMDLGDGIEFIHTMKYPDKIYKKGGIVHCEKCNEPLLIQKCDIKAGEPTMAEYLEAIPPQKEPVNGELCICHKCGHNVVFDKIEEP